MSKTFVVFGATGNQGGSAINCVLNDPELSKEWKIRGITRDVSKPAALDLKQRGVELASADLADSQSLKKAMEGAHTVYLVTTSIRQENGDDTELVLAKGAVDAAVEAGVQFIILSGMTNVAKATNGKLSKVTHFDVKAYIEDYIRSLSIRGTYIYPGAYMENFSTMLAPRPVGDGTYAITNIWNPDTLLPLVDVPDDMGKWVAAILADQDKYDGKVLRAATKEYTAEEVCRIISDKTGKTVKYNQIPDDVYKGFLPPSSAEKYLQMSQLFRDFKYFGPDQTQLIQQTAQQARGKLTSFEEYLDKYPLKLE